ncbi:MAG: 30S ribosomal protein S7 [Bacilli bacterium]|nr:30S ribosomal protein S7 [Bacilli bacterium]MDD3305225.1 30S ribosomal protein S7 [Bacilli bacterium]MDD4054090.1 30S ribosomal protein S7 [Bacilli bacterium]MDD4411869.1 30S ribosomal protein S7 [Bacilli bacterium]
MRKRQAIKRDILADPIYGSKVIARLINQVMLEGKKGKAQTIVYKALAIVKEKTGQAPDEVFHKALENIKPALEVKSRRVGGANYQVPTEVREERSLALGLRWLVDYARKRGAHTMYENLANEIVDAFNSTGAAVKKREDTHRMAEANKAFAHYRW